MGKAKNKRSGIVSKFFTLFGIFLLSLIIFLYLAMFIICNGPSERARDLFVTTCMETSFAKYFPPLVLSKQTIADIQKANSIIDNGHSSETQLDFSDVSDKTQGEDIEIHDVTGPTYKGKMMIVKDPSRVVVGTSSDSFSPDKPGKKLDKIIRDAGAVAGVNAGGFADEGGVGNGGMPLGLVIKDGKMMNGSLDVTYTVIGFDDKNMLHVGSMTGQQAVDKKLRDAVSFGPSLIVDGVPMEVSGSGGGLNPRTAIGQREDGAVLILVVDGRQPHSLGANFKDLIDIMENFGAVNAGNLDGGSSSMMYYEGNLLNVCASLYGPRRIPTAILVTEGRK